MIPKNIFQFWHDKDYLPKILESNSDQLRLINSGYNYQLVDDVETANFLREKFSSRFSKIYQDNQIPASRADLARLAFLYWYGGFYIDLSFRMRQRLDEVFDLSGDCVLIRRDDILKYKDRPLEAHRINGFIAVKEKSEFIYSCLLRAFSNLSQRRHNKVVTWATGPKMFNEIFESFEEDLMVNDYSFKVLIANKIMQYYRVQGVSNSWLVQQECGIMPEEK